MAPRELLALDDRAKGLGQVFAPPPVFRGRCRPRGGERLETARIADGRRRGEKSHRQRLLGALQRLSQVVRRQPALAGAERLVHLTARGNPLRALTGGGGSLAFPKAIDEAPQGRDVGGV